MAESPITTRRAVLDDVPKIFQMLKDHVDYSKEPLSNFELTEEALVRDGFGENPWCQFLVAETNEQINDDNKQKEIIGYAMYYHTYSSWKGRTLFVEELYVEKQYRGKGVGRMLMRDVAKIAKENGCYKLNWCVLSWNEAAKNFYKSIGGELCGQWHVYALQNEVMLELAG